MDRFSKRTIGIEEFVRVAQTRSFVRAAESLNLSTSGVAKAIRALEARLGVRLINRTTRSVSLTDDGSAFYARAKQLMADFQEAEDSVCAAGVDLQGMVRIEMPVTYGRLIFMPRLVKFLARYPKLTVEARLSDHRDVNLVADGIDLALHVGEIEDADFITRPLGRIELGTYAHPKYIERAGLPARPADLRNHRLVAFVYPSGRMQKMFYEKDRKPIVIDTAAAAASFNNGDAMTDAIVAGLGVAQLPAFHATHLLASGSLVRILEGWDAPGPPIQLLYASRRLPMRVRALIDFVVNEPTC